MKNRLDYNKDGKVSTMERARAFSLLMMAMEEEKQDDWGDYDEFYADVNDSTSYTENEVLNEYDEFYSAADDWGEADDDIVSVAAPAPVQTKSQPTEEELEKIYQETLEKMRNAKTHSDYFSASIYFSSLKDYKDSKKLCEQCKKKHDEMWDKQMRWMNIEDALCWIFFIFGIPLIIAFLFGFH